MRVIDASVAVKGYMREVGSDAAIDLLTGLDRLLAPELIRLEVLGAITRRVRLGEMDADDARVRCRTWERAVRQDVVRVIPHDDLLAPATELALELKHPIADCLYLALAQRERIPLVTADRAFRDRAAHVYSAIDLLAGCEGV